MTSFNQNKENQNSGSTQQPELKDKEKNYGAGSTKEGTQMPGSQSDKSRQTGQKSDQSSTKKDPRAA